MPDRSPDSRPTLDSVAAHAGVSRQTVSNVLNNPDVVRTATLRRVRAAIDELGYRPSTAARQLRTRRSRTFGMRLEPVRDGVNGLVLDQFLHHLVEVAQDVGYRVQLFTAADDEAELATFSDLLVSSDLDGFLLTGTHHGDPRTAWLAVRGVPFVTFGRAARRPRGSPPSPTRRPPSCAPATRWPSAPPRPAAPSSASTTPRWPPRSG